MTPEPMVLYMFEPALGLPISESPLRPRSRCTVTSPIALTSPGLATRAAPLTA